MTILDDLLARAGGDGRQAKLTMFADTGALASLACTACTGPIEVPTALHDNPPAAAVRHSYTPIDPLARFGSPDSDRHTIARLLRLEGLDGDALAVQVDCQIRINKQLGLATCDFTRSRLRALGADDDRTASTRRSAPTTATAGDRARVRAQLAAEGLPADDLHVDVELRQLQLLSVSVDCWLHSRSR